MWCYWYSSSFCRCMLCLLAGCYSGSLLQSGVQAAHTSMATLMPNTEPTWQERNVYSLPPMVITFMYPNLNINIHTHNISIVLKYCNCILLLWSLLILPFPSSFVTVLPALALAMGRDNVSGGVAHLAVITETGVEHVVVPGDKLPKFHDEWCLQRPIKVSLTKRVGSIFFLYTVTALNTLAKPFLFQLLDKMWKYVHTTQEKTLIKL